MNNLIETLIADLITAEMEMPAGSVWIRDQNKVVPTDKSLYVVVGRAASRPFGTSRTVEATLTGMKEIIRVQVRESVIIDVLSAGNAALNRQWEVLAAIKSTRAQQIQEENCFKISGVPAAGFLNTSSAEGGSMINRFTLVIECIVWYRKERDLASGDYYDDFDTRVDDETTIGGQDGLIEFNISASNIPYPPEGFSLIVDNAGQYVVDSSGAYLINRKV